jgi:hypothetical protein
MDDLTARLESLLRRLRPCAEDDRMGEQFRRELELLIAEYGSQTVNAALDALPDETSSSVSLH